MTNEVAKLEDTTVKTIMRQLSDDQSFVEDSRQFVDIPRNSAATHRWMFMTVNTSEATEDEPSYIRLSYSNNPHDFPASLPDGCLLLYDGVIHCLPHNQTFSDPIRLSFALPDSVSLSQIICVMHSDTDVGAATRWTIMDRPEYVPASEYWHNHEPSSHQNKAILLADSKELLLVLRHFCIFAILVDGQEERAQNIAVDTYLKIAVSSFRYTVNILVLIGCNNDNYVSIPQYNNDVLEERDNNYYRLLDYYS